MNALLQVLERRAKLDADKLVSKNSKYREYSKVKGGKTHE